MAMHSIQLFYYVSIAKGQIHLQLPKLLFHFHKPLLHYNNTFLMLHCPFISSLGKDPPHLWCKKQQFTNTSSTSAFFIQCSKEEQVHNVVINFQSARMTECFQLSSILHPQIPFVLAPALFQRCPKQNQIRCLFSVLARCSSWHWIFNDFRWSIVFLSLQMFLCILVSIHSFIFLLEIGIQNTPSPWCP